MTTPNPYRHYINPTDRRERERTNASNVLSLLTAAKGEQLSADAYTAAFGRWHPNEIYNAMADLSLQGIEAGYTVANKQITGLFLPAQSESEAQL